MITSQAHLPALLLTLLAIAALLTSCGSPRPLGAGGRITENVYTSADGRVTARVPPQLGQADVRIEERRVLDGRTILAMANVFGATFTIVRIPLPADDAAGRDLAGMRAAMFGVEGVTSADLVDGTHGRELRISGVQKDASPITTITNGVKSPNDLAVAQRILVLGDERIELGTGITLLPHLTREQALEEARKRLESFAAGVEFRTAPPKP